MTEKTLPTPGGKGFARIRASQDRYVARIQAIPQPCSACATPVSMTAAQQVDGNLYRCPHCNSTMQHVVPAFDLLRAWYWIIPGSLRMPGDPLEGEHADHGATHEADDGVRS